MYSIDEIVKRYNDSLMEYVAYLEAKNEHNADKQARHLRNLGEGLSQTLELALKLHIQTHSPTTSWSRYATPTMIKTFYLDDAGVRQCLYSATAEVGKSPTIDFAYIKAHKSELTNNSKHQGGNVDPTVAEEYIKQCKLFIKEYLDKDALLRDVAYYMDANQDLVQQFYIACDRFQRENRTYILLTQELKDIDKHYYNHFALAPWDIIIDLHKESANIGFASGAYGGIDIPYIYKTSDVISPEDVSMITMRKPIYFYANGFKDERAYSDFDDWNSHYYSKLNKFIEVLALSVNTQRTIVVSVLNDEDFTEHIRNIINRHFHNVQFVIANDSQDVLFNYANRKNGKVIHLHTNIEQINNCFNDYLAHKENDFGKDIVTVPYREGEGNGILTKKELEEFEESFEVLYKGIGDGGNEECETFLRGETQLTWQGVKRNFAAMREHFQKIYVKPMETEVKKGLNKVYIIHEPGYGGTTVARQLAYQLHESYPVLWLKEYRAHTIMQKLIKLHERTRMTLIIFMEIPSIISADDFEYLYNTSNQTRPFVFVGIMRGKGSHNTITVTDWGNDTILLNDKYRPIINTRYNGQRLNDKLATLNSILSTTDSYKRTPFYYGMLAYEKDFVAADNFFEKFAKSVYSNENQRKCLIYLAIADYYAEKSIPEAFFRTIFKVDKDTIFKIENYFSESDSIYDSIILVENNGNARNIRLKYPFFSEVFLSKLLREKNDGSADGWTKNLGEYCKEFIIDSASSIVAETMECELLQPLFIGSSREREGDKFTKIIDKIQEEDRINIFTTLFEQFPDNSHFCSHLARYYSLVEKNTEIALEYADKAIRLSASPDPLLHHMKGMCLSNAITNKIDTINKQIKLGMPINMTEVNIIVGTLLAEAEREFEKTREIQQNTHHIDEFGFIPNIQLLLRVFDFYVQVTNEKKQNVIGNAKEPYISWIDKTQVLLDNVHRIYEEGKESELFIKCETDLWKEYENYSSLLELLHNKLTKTPHPALVRRQIARIYMHRDNDYKISQKANERILSLMRDNLKMDGKNISNFILWFKAARYSLSLSTNEILAQIAQWYAVNPSKDLAFYGFVFNAIKAYEGSSEATILAQKYLKECRAMGGSNQIFIKEWYGESAQKIISDYERKENSQEDKRKVVLGYVTEYQHAGNAIIRLDCGLDVFFKPSVKGISASCLNHNVSFYLGFSYDGLRADNESVVIISNQ